MFSSTTSDLAELDAAAVDAWIDYRESLRGLSGRDYEHAEAEAWERLQTELSDIERQRQGFVG